MNNIMQKFGSFSTSNFEMQSFKSESLLKSCNDPQLLEISEGDRTTQSDNLSGCGQLNYSASSCSQMLNSNGLAFLEIADDSFQSKDTLQSIVQSCCCGLMSHNKSISSSSDSIQECKHHKFQENKSVSESLRSLSHDSLLCFEKVINVENHKCSKSQQEKQHSVSIEKEAMKKQKRIRWTQDLHEKFIDSVNRLGGAKKATPKAILKLMNCHGLTIFHVKSHLQKYRVGHLIPETMEENSEKLDSKT
ncbi:hypothetical protein CDL12_11761 [Handroanthus impetiginosus]|uniref:HTH myb-type domain-containing protein n=1 Tax=Handroanthus impetiginosus TaxID=429701 RepID=A0A2G9HDL8_9LAMI|nr:hypothetical protein CDL12_11761 [Handroanthus impetiginosus]